MIVFSNISVIQFKTNILCFFPFCVSVKVPIFETHRIPGGLSPVAVCVQPSVFQLSHTHSTLECVSAAPAGLYVCQHSACKSSGRTGVQHTNQYMSTNTVNMCVFFLSLLSFSQYWDLSLLFSTVHQWPVFCRDGAYWCFTGFHGNRAVRCSRCAAGGGSGVPVVSCRQGQNSQAAWNCPSISSCYTVQR